MLEHTPRVHAVFLSNARGHRSRADVLVTQTGSTLVSGQILTETGSVGGVRRFAAYEAGGAAGPADAVLVTRLPARNGTARAVAFVGHAELNALDLTGLDAAARIDLARRGLIVRGEGIAGDAGAASEATVAYMDDDYVDPDYVE